MLLNRNIVFLEFLNFLSSLSINTQGWGYLNLHCRDNDNAPVDWWYIYKPPSDLMPFFELGHNFTFITPDSRGRWEPTYVDHLAVAIYDTRESNRSFAGSVARGVLMADALGGVWIYHTVPGLVNVRKDRQSFPEKESANGHLLMCISLDLEVVNAVVHNLRNIYPKLTYLKIPEKLQDLLPGWNYLEMPLTGKKIKPLKFVTRGNTLLVEVLARRPGDKQSVYQRFASSKNIVLDVYGQSNSDYISSVCSKKYSVRNIENISLKLPETVIYLRNKADRSWFAVSTAAHWQDLGSGPKQYWTCISNLDKEDKRGIGGDLLCVEHCEVWHTFDNLKVSEPNCME